jgi:hypothetical protein
MTKKEDIWQCGCCGNHFGRHDQYFDGICGDCESLVLTADEKEKLEKIYSDLRIQIKQDNSLNKISGGFCNVEFSECNSDSIFLNVIYGTADEGGSYATHDSYELDRETFKIINIENVK